VRTEKHQGNRALCVAVISEAFESTSCRTHIGTTAPSQVVFEPFRGLPGGDYIAMAALDHQLIDGRHVTITVRHPFTILPGLGE
jgi:hypothetical protein